MLPDNFNFAMLPDVPGTGSMRLQEIGMLASTIESIDYAITSWLKEDLKLSARTNEGYTKVPVLWQAPERAFQLKNKKELRDDAGALKLPIVSIERTGVTKDPSRKGSFQAHTYSGDGTGRSGRMVIARRIVEDKTRNFAVADSMRMLPKGKEHQKYFPRPNKKVVIQTLSVPIPVYINVDYKITIKTEYQQQMNDIVAPFMTRTGQINAFVLKRNGHLYEAFIEQDFSHNNNLSNLGEESRMFSTDIVIKVLGYLIGEGENDDRRLVKIEENIVEITFPRETEPLPGDPALIED